MLFIIVALIFSLDQISKYLIVKNLFLHQSIPVVKGIFHLTLVYNRGAAFGILKNQIYLFVLVSVLSILLIISALRGCGFKKISLYSVSLAFILAGAFGNLIDRLVLGYVIDFLDFRVWPVFNIADSAITVGASLLGWCLLFNKEKVKT